MQFKGILGKGGKSDKRVRVRLLKDGAAGDLYIQFLYYPPFVKAEIPPQVLSNQSGRCYVDIASLDLLFGDIIQPHFTLSTPK